MRITIFAAGSRGDIQPCVALAKGLLQAGYRICLAAPQDFAAFVAEHGIDFHPLRGDVQQMMASDTGRAFMDTAGANPLKSIGAMRELMAPVIMRMVEDAYEACRAAEAVICLGVFSPFGQSIAEARGIPMLQIEPTPLLPTKAFAAASWPIQRNLGGWHNTLSGLAMLQVVWMWYRPFVKSFRQQLGLRARGSAYFYRALKSSPMLGAYSPTVIVPPRDWPPGMHATGYLFLDSTTSWQPSPALESFLDAGDPPVYVGFGSMGGRNPQRMADLVLQALALSGQRGVLMTGWGGLQAETAPQNVFVLDAAPHRWLFPHMAAVVHHGGAGTTAEGLRAGVPSIIVPFVLDQPFWGARVKALGVGPPPLPQKRLSAERLAEAIATAVSDERMKQRARDCGAAIRAENGLENAVKIVGRYLAEPAARAGK